MQKLIVKSVRLDYLHPILADRLEVVQDPTIVDELHKGELRELVSASYENVSPDAKIHGVLATYRIPRSGALVDLWDFDYDEPTLGQPSPSISKAEQFKIAAGDFVSKAKNATARTAKSLSNGTRNLINLPFAIRQDPILVIHSDDKLDRATVAECLISALQQIRASVGFGTAMHRRINSDLQNLETSLRQGVAGECSLALVR